MSKQNHNIDIARIINEYREMPLRKSSPSPTSNFDSMWIGLLLFALVLYLIYIWLLPHEPEISARDGADADHENKNSQ